MTRLTTVKTVPLNSHCVHAELGGLSSQGQITQDLAGNCQAGGDPDGKETQGPWIPTLPGAWLLQSWPGSPSQSGDYGSVARISSSPSSLITSPPCPVAFNYSLCTLLINLWATQLLQASSYSWFWKLCNWVFIHYHVVGENQSKQKWTGLRPALLVYCHFLVCLVCVQKSIGLVPKFEFFHYMLQKYPNRLFWPTK